MFRYRFTALCITAFTIGAFVVLQIHGTITLALAAVAVLTCAVLLVLYFRKQTKSRRLLHYAAALVCALAVGMLYSTLHVSINDGYSRFDGDSGIIEARVISVDDSIADSRADVRVESCSFGIPAGTVIRLYINGETELAEGDLAVLNAKISSHNKNYLYALGVKLTGSAEILSSNRDGHITYAAKNYLSGALDEIMGANFQSETISVAKAITIRDINKFPAYYYSAYSNAGISHVLSVSGMHLTVIVMSLLWVLEKLFVPKRARCVIGIIIAFAYGVVAGFSPSVLRSVIMLTVMLGCSFFVLKRDGVTSLFMALFVILIIDPFSIYSVSLQLSFASCLGIFVAIRYMNVIEDFIKIRFIGESRVKNGIFRAFSVIFSPLLLSGAATLYSFPLLLLNFDTVSYITLPANLLLTPLFVYVLLLLFFSMLVFPLFGAAICSYIAYPAGVYIEFVNNLLSRLFEADFGSVSLKFPLMWLCGLLAITAIIIPLLFRKRAWKSVVALIVAFCCVFFASAVANEKAVLGRDMAVICDNGTQKYAFFADGKDTLYIDMGGFTVSTDVVYKSGVTAINCVVMLGTDSDSCNRIKTILDEFSVKKLYLPNDDERDVEAVLQLMRLAERKNCAVMDYESEFLLKIGNIGLHLCNDRFKVQSGDIIEVTTENNDYCIVTGNISLPESFKSNIFAIDYICEEEALVYCENLYISKNCSALLTNGLGAKSFSVFMQTETKSERRVTLDES